MSMRKTMTKKERLLREYEREMLRSAFASVLWNVISHKRRDGMTLKALADKLRVHKSAVSRWFSGASPNWEINTIADIASAIDVELRLTAIDRQTGRVYSESDEEIDANYVMYNKSHMKTIGISRSYEVDLLAV